MKPLQILAIAAVLLAGSSALFAKTATIGIYAIIDRVTLEADGASPDTIRIYGVFVIPVPKSGESYQAAQRGYMEFRIRPDLEEAVRKDWSELKAAAGTGQVVGFGQFWVPNPRDRFGNPHLPLDIKLLKDGESSTRDSYPLPHARGVVKTGDRSDPNFEKIAAQLRGTGSVTSNEAQ